MEGSWWGQQGIYGSILLHKEPSLQLVLLLTSWLPYSIAAFKPSPLLSHYTASKYAVRGLTQAFALELGTHKITVNAFAPGIVGTAMWELIDEEMGKLKGVAKGETFKKWTGDLIALGRSSVPSDVSNVVSFLSSPDSDYMTGQTLIVDGGIVYT